MSVGDFLVNMMVLINKTRIITIGQLPNVSGDEWKRHVEWVRAILTNVREARWWSRPYLTLDNFAPTHSTNLFHSSPDTLGNWPMVTIAGLEKEGSGIEKKAC